MIGKLLKNINRITKIGKPFARWAIVAFIDAHGVEALPRSQTHKYYVV